jgi:hypothetical protein
MYLQLHSFSDIVTSSINFHFSYNKPVHYEINLQKDMYHQTGIITAIIIAVHHNVDAQL